MSTPSPLPPSLTSSSSVSSNSSYSHTPDSVINARNGRESRGASSASSSRSNSSFRSSGRESVSSSVSGSSSSFGGFYGIGGSVLGSVGGDYHSGFDIASNDVANMSNSDHNDDDDLSVSSELMMSRKLLRRRHATQERNKKRKRKQMENVAKDSLGSLGSLSVERVKGGSILENVSRNPEDNDKHPHWADDIEGQVEDCGIIYFQYSTPHRDDLRKTRVTRSRNNGTFFELEFPTFSPAKKNRKSSL